MFLRKLTGLAVFSRNMSCNITHYIEGPHNFINGVKVLAESNELIPLYQPATGKIVGHVRCSAENDVNAAVAAAETAHSSWSSLSGFERGKYLSAAASIIRERMELIAQIEVFDTGKPIWEARADISSCADALQYYSGAGATFQGSYHKLPNGSFAHVINESLGVVCGIGAWNYPFQVMSWKVAPALAVGNTFVFKPSEHTPLSAIALAEIFTDVGILPGVVNIVQGDGKTGELLCKNEHISKVSFTGSVEIGKRIMKSCSDGIKRITMELGGKSPLIIFEDSDVIEAVKATMMGNFLTQGEVCTNCTRVYVHRSLYNQFVKELIIATEKLVIGNPSNNETCVGATITKEHAEKVLGFIEQAKREGASAKSGGERVILKNEELKDGFYLSPCVLTDCTDQMTIVKEEVFGAVVSILTFDNEDEAISRANNTQFGLAAGVMTKDLKRAHRVASQLNAGIVWVNNYNVFPIETPYGGFKCSGFGRENGLAPLKDYSQTKTVYVEMNEIDCPIFKK